MTTSNLKEGIELDFELKKETTNKKSGETLNNLNHFQEMFENPEELFTTFKDDFTRFINKFPEYKGRVDVKKGLEAVSKLPLVGFVVQIPNTVHKCIQTQSEQYNLINQSFRPYLGCETKTFNQFFEITGRPIQREAAEKTRGIFYNMPDEQKEIFRLAVPKFVTNRCYLENMPTISWELVFDVPESESPLWSFEFGEFEESKFFTYVGCTNGEVGLIVIEKDKRERILKILKSLNKTVFKGKMKPMEWRGTYYNDDIEFEEEFTKGSPNLRISTSVLKNRIINAFQSANAFPDGLIEEKQYTERMVFEENLRYNFSDSIGEAIYGHNRLYYPEVLAKRYMVTREMLSKDI